MRGEIIGVSKAHWAEFGLLEKPSRVDVVLKNKYRKLTFYLLHEDSFFGVARCTPYPRKEDEILKEARILKKLHAEVSVALRQTIPRPLLVQTIEGLPVLFTRYVPGKCMAKCVSQRKGIFSEHLERVTGWLIDLNKSLKGTRKDGAALGKEILRVLNKKSQSQQAVGYFLSLKLGMKSQQAAGYEPNLSNQSQIAILSHLT